MHSFIVGKNEDFFEHVYQIVRLVPAGRVTTYGAIAKALGTAKSSRMVGWAMNACHNKPDVPAHRVVNRIGLLTGKMHFNGENEMENRLLSEGIQVKNNRIVNFEVLFWDPMVEIQ